MSTNNKVTWMSAIFSLTVLALTLLGQDAHATGKPDFKNGHDNRVEKKEKPAKPLKSSSTASAAAAAAAVGVGVGVGVGTGVGTGGNAAAVGNGGTGGNSVATSKGGDGGQGGAGGIAEGGQVVVQSGAFSNNGNGLRGHMVPDVSTTAPLTSTSCRNGISAGGSGNGWGGLIGFFTEDEVCELRLLWEQFRTAGQYDKADKLLDGMMLMRCDKMGDSQRKMFGDLCPAQKQKDPHNVLFNSN